jgi:hypothetical protein
MPCSPCQPPFTCIYEVSIRKITGPNLVFCYPFYPASLPPVLFRQTASDVFRTFMLLWPNVSPVLCGRSGSRVYFFLSLIILVREIISCQDKMHSTK